MLQIMRNVLGNTQKKIIRRKKDTSVAFVHLLQFMNEIWTCMLILSIWIWRNISVVFAIMQQVWEIIWGNIWNLFIRKRHRLLKCFYRISWLFLWSKVTQVSYVWLCFKYIVCIHNVMFENNINIHNLFYHLLLFIAILTILKIHIGKRYFWCSYMNNF